VSTAVVDVVGVIDALDDRDVGDVVLELAGGLVGVDPITKAA
jgi:hypothetical protein